MNADALLAECEPVVRHQVRRAAHTSGALHLELDLRQHARIALWRAADQAPADDLHRIKWATVLIRRGAFDGVRVLMGRHRSARLQAERATCAEVPEQPQACEAASLASVRRLIERIAELPERRRRLVEAFVDGMTTAELAAEWGVHPSAVRQQTAAVREWVRRRL